MAAKKRSGRPGTGPRPGPGGRPNAAAGHPKAAAASRTRPSAATAKPAGNRPAVPPNKVMLATAPLLTRLSTLPKLLMPVLIAVLVLVGLGMGGVVGLLCLLPVAGLLGWLLAAFWPLTSPSGRVLRTAAILALVVVGVLQAL